MSVQQQQIVMSYCLFYTNEVCSSITHTTTLDLEAAEKDIICGDFCNRKWSKIIHNKLLWVKLQLDCFSSTSTRQVNSPKTVRTACGILRPPLESPRREESRSSWSIFVKLSLTSFFKNNSPSNAQIETDYADLDLRH